MRQLLWVVLVFGCGKGSSKTVALDTPEAAARCQLAAIRAKDVAKWVPCMHPTIRDEATTTLREKAAQSDFWPSSEKRAAPLERVTGSDFKVEPMPAGKEAIGDQQASYRLEQDSFHVVRSGGRWYIVDTGI